MDIASAHLYNTAGFEILTANGCRFRYRGDVQWRYVTDGDIEDFTRVEVFRVEPETEDEVVIHTYNSVVRVGEVAEDVCLEMPCERRRTKCPWCGWIERSES